MRKFLYIVVLISVSVACAIPAGFAPAATPQKDFWGLAPMHATPVAVYTVTGQVNVRTCPSTTCGVVEVKYPGDIVEAQCFENSWCQVENGYIWGPCLGLEGSCK